MSRRLFQHYPNLEGEEMWAAGSEALTQEQTERVGRTWELQEGEGP